MHAPGRALGLLACRCVSTPLLCGAASAAIPCTSTPIPSTSARCYSDGAQSEEVPAQRKKRRKDGWMDRLPPGTGRHGVKLKARDPDRFERMRLILGYYDLPENRHKPAAKEAAKKLRSVAINQMQTLCHLDFDETYKGALLSYRVHTLNRGLVRDLRATDAYLERLQAADFMPAIPGLTAAGAEGGQGPAAAGASSDGGGRNAGREAADPGTPPA